MMRTHSDLQRTQRRFDSGRRPATPCALSLTTVTFEEQSGKTLLVLHELVDALKEALDRDRSDAPERLWRRGATWADVNLGRHTGA